MIFPLSIEALELFRMRPGNRRKKLTELFENLDNQNFGLMDITFRKCMSDTSIKGVNFYFIEI